MKALQNIDRLQVNPDFLLNLLSVYESKGKEFYYDQVLERDRAVITTKVVEENAFYITRFFGIDVTDARLNSLIKRELQAKNKTEFFIHNLKNAMKSIHKKRYFDLIVNEIRDLSTNLSKKTYPVDFNKFKTDNTLLVIENKYKSKREMLEELVKLYKKTVNSKKIEITQVITNFYIDFLQLNIFTNYNIEIANIILYTLLYNEFSVFKYVSFFKHFINIKEDWNLAIAQANYNWQTGYAQTDQLSKLLIKTIISSYKEIDEFLHKYEFESKLNKTDNIENTIMKGKEVFTKNDIRVLHPTVSETTIDRTLKRLKDDNIIRPLGRGRSTKWVRLVEGNNKPSYEGTLFSDFGE